MQNTISRFDNTIEPPVVMPSVYGPKTLPTQRATDIENMVSLKVKALFPDIPEAIYQGGTDVSPIREATKAILKNININMDMIKPKDSVNILCSEHGFGILGGFAYAEMIKTIRDEIEARTGNSNLRLVVIAWLGFKEAEEIIEFYDFDEAFKGKTRGATPFDRGVPIETEIGTLYGLGKVYNAKWIIHTHYDDPREIYAHRVIDRVTKPFGMSYARFETRSIFHSNFGSRSGNFVSRAIADSDFVRGKLAFSVDMCSSPDGIIGVDADNDLERLGDRITTNILSAYGKMLDLFRHIDDCVAVIDGAKWPYYVHAGGMIFGQLYYGQKDWYDLESDASANISKLVRTAINFNLKAVVVNQCLTGLSISTMPMIYPTVVASEEMAETMRRDMANPTFMDKAETAPNLQAAIDWAVKKGGTDKVIFFDGTYGSINLSPSMAQHLKEKAAECNAAHDENLPRWLKQRGIDPEAVKSYAYAH